MTDTSDWEGLNPVLSISLIRRFLAHVHAFTVVGLEAQATAFSCEEDGVIQYLALLPQKNEVSNVTSRSTGPTELDAVERFRTLKPQGNFTPRCWIHTHPRWKAYMSSTDIFQLYACACEFRQAFGIVLSPRGEGLKALCVHLTQNGFRLVARFCQEATRMKVDVMQYALSQISASHEKLYCQVPFDISSEPCHVVYLRGKEVVHQLRDFIISGKADECWIRPASPSGIYI